MFNENRLRWRRHVLRRGKTVAVGVVKGIYYIDGKRGRPKKKSLI